MATLSSQDDVRAVQIEPEGLEGSVGLPVDAKGLVIFAHGSGSGRLSPRNQRVASILRHAGLATLLLDLLTPAEEENRRNVFDIDLLASRLVIANRWARRTAGLAGLPTGYFGASTGAGAALVAAADPESDISAVVSRGGRPDLAGDALRLVRAPTLLIVGGADEPVIEMNQSALDQLSCTKQLVIVPGAGHLFEEPGALDEVARHAQRWFCRFLPGQAARSVERDVFEDRYDAGRQLAEKLMPYKTANPIVLALPRGGVPVAFEVAKALEAPLDVVFVRKIGAPGQPELGLGAIVDGAHPELVLNDDIVQQVGPSSAYIEAQCKRELAEIERRRELYRPGRPPPKLRDRTVIVVDDGIATGGSVKAVLRAVARAHPRRVVLAVPVAPRETIAELSTDANDIVCLSAPEQFRAVGLHYRHFDQTTDSEVVQLLQQA
jgi:putative phosphoribosyl transferase